MSLERTVRGHIEGVIERGRRRILMIAVAEQDAVGIVQAIGHTPERHRPAPVALALGRAAEVLGEISEEPAGAPPVRALPDRPTSGFDLGAAVAAIAEATVELHIWTDLVAGQPAGPPRVFAQRNRAEKADHLRELQDELTAEFRAVVSGLPA